MKKSVLTIKSVSASAFVLVLGLAACSGSDSETRLRDDLAPPSRAALMAPPVSPDVNQMHPALQLAKNRGLKTNVYFNEELQQSIARLAGMEETLGRLQNDLQGSAMAMQRVEMMRQEVEAMNVRLQSLQERLMYAGPVLGPAPVAALEPVTMEQTTTTTTTMTPAPVAGDAGLRPTPLMGELAAPETPVTAQVAKPVMDENKAPAPKADAPAPVNTLGVADVRIGTHADKVRIVMDVGGSELGYTANVDTAEKLLTVELPKTAWNATKSKTLSNPLIASYTAQDSGSGTIVAFTLKGDTKILNQSTLKGNPARLVIDLSR